MTTRVETFHPAPRPVTRHVYAQVEGPDWVIATSPEHATEILEAFTGEPPESADSWRELAGAEAIEVGIEDVDEVAHLLRQAESCGADPDAATVTFAATGLDFLAYGIVHQRTSRVTIRAAAAWWSKLPSGFLCSSEY